MSKYDYPNWHEIKDLVMIYRDNEWDNARLCVWDPIRCREYNLVFCGSTRPGVESKEGVINFIITPVNRTALDKIKFSCNLVYYKFGQKFERIQIKIRNFLFRLWI